MFRLVVAVIALFIGTHAIAQQLWDLGQVELTQLHVGTVSCTLVPFTGNAHYYQYTCPKVTFREPFSKPPVVLVISITAQPAPKMRMTSQQFKPRDIQATGFTLEPVGYAGIPQLGQPPSPLYVVWMAGIAQP